MTGKEEHSQLVVNVLIWLQKMLRLKCGMVKINQETSSSQLQVKVSRIELQTKICEDFTITENAPPYEGLSLLRNYAKWVNMVRCEFERLPHWS